ncbi:mycofactocin biosynthesis chaperone MftB [Mycobacterium sp.]|uniref:mycofactocin biosynthesis chaperone MftB n=1 Tax=Mycobacterium sp. TaxID=1785 RepID=UPI003BACBCBF
MWGLLTVPAPAEARQTDSGGFDPDRGWRLNPQVAVRPEPFGALLYHFGTRKLSFLKNRTILEVLRSLPDHSDVRSACRAAGVDECSQEPYLHALGVLASSDMLLPQECIEEVRCQ